MIRNKDMENLFGMMEKDIKEIGEMENNMEKANFFFQLKKFGKKVIGKMEKELIGLNNFFLLIYYIYKIFILIKFYS